MSKARTRASHKYNLENYERIEFNVLKGEKEVIYNYIEKNHPEESKQSYIRKLIYKDMGIPEPDLSEKKEE